jgi:hypothetical protein
VRDALALGPLLALLARALPLPPRLSHVKRVKHLGDGGADGTLVLLCDAARAPPDAARAQRDRGSCEVAALAGLHGGDGGGGGGGSGGGGGGGGGQFQAHRHRAADGGD